VVEQRRTQRFQLELPVRIMRTGDGHLAQGALTRNISASGVLFKADAQVPLGGSIEYVVTLTNVRGVEVDLRCTGKVVRSEKPAPELTQDGYLIAATLERYHFVRHDA
jgi:hypothetical protein